jgi:hypothetical protein
MNPEMWIKTVQESEEFKQKLMDHFLIYGRCGYYYDKDGTPVLLTNEELLKLKEEDESK